MKGGLYLTVRKEETANFSYHYVINGVKNIHGSFDHEEFLMAVAGTLVSRILNYEHIIFKNYLPKNSRKDKALRKAFDIMEGYEILIKGRKGLIRDYYSGKQKVRKILRSLEEKSN